MAKVNWKYVGIGIALVVVVVLAVVLPVTLMSKDSKDTSSRSIKASESELTQLILKNLPVAPAVPMEQVQAAQPLDPAVAVPLYHSTSSKSATAVKTTAAAEPVAVMDPPREPDTFLQPLIVPPEQEAEWDRVSQSPPIRLPQETKGQTGPSSIFQASGAPQASVIDGVQRAKQTVTGTQQTSGAVSDRIQNLAPEHESELQNDAAPSTDQAVQPRSIHRHLYSTVIGIDNKHTLPKFPMDISVYCMLKVKQDDVSISWLLTWISVLSKVAMLQERELTDDGYLILNQAVKAAEDVDYQQVMDMITDPEWDLVEFIFPDSPEFSMILIRGSRIVHLLKHLKQVFIDRNKQSTDTPVLSVPALLADYYREANQHWLKLNYES
jgi:hypothetical protein